MDIATISRDTFKVNEAFRNNLVLDGEQKVHIPFRPILHESTPEKIFNSLVLFYCKLYWISENE